jgi:hypothetical protein
MDVADDEDQMTEETLWHPFAASIFCNRYGEMDMINLELKSLDDAKKEVMERMSVILKEDKEDAEGSSEEYDSDEEEEESRYSFKIQQLVKRSDLPGEGQTCPIYIHTGIRRNFARYFTYILVIEGDERDFLKKLQM